MRTLFAAAIAAVLAAGTLSASAQTTATPAPAAPVKSKTKAKACKGRAEADCQAPECTWVAPTKTKAGKDVKGYCRKPPKKAAAKTQ